MVAYTTGDVIEITAHFTGPVTNGAPNTGEQADYAGLYIQVGENRRLAEMLRGDGADTIVFGYQVQSDDADADGISVEGGGPGTGTLLQRGPTATAEFGLSNTRTAESIVSSTA